MLKERARLIARALYGVDMAMTILAFFLSYIIRAHYLTQLDLIGIYPIKRYLWLLVPIIPFWTILLWIFGAYKSYRTTSFLYELFAVAKSIIMGGLIVSAIAFAAKSHYLSRTLILTFVVVNLALMIAERFAVRAVSWMVRKKGYNFRNVVIVGTGELAQDVARRIQSYDQWGLRIVGFVAEKTGCAETTLGGFQVIGSLGEIERLIMHMPIDEVIFAVSGTRLEDLEDTFLMLEDQGVIARMVANIFPHVIAKIQLEDLETIPLLTFATVPTNTLALAAKRFSDVVLSVALLIISLPIMVVAAILVKVGSPGPLLFRQKRAGLHGRIFTLYKFRSMYVDAEVRKKELESLNEMSGPVFKIKDDPRVTPVGRFLRKTSIDELPQLWNVFRGDMSIVGPRPPVPEEVGRYERWQRRRLSMRPGLTCLWQIGGRNRITDFDEWVRLDLQYIDTWSLGLDLRIFLKTIPVVLFRKGAT